MGSNSYFSCKTLLSFSYHCDQTTGATGEKFGRDNPKFSKFDLFDLKLRSQCRQKTSHDSRSNRSNFENMEGYGRLITEISKLF